jgi:cytochrome P450
MLDKECPYLDAIVKGALRLGAVTGGFPRRARETIVIDGKQVPTGWPVFSNVHLTHQLYPVRHSLTRRFAYECIQKISTRAMAELRDNALGLIPFGAGPRYCLGAKLAEVEIQVFLAMFARAIPGSWLVSRNEANSKIHWNPQSMIPKPANGVRVEILGKEWLVNGLVDLIYKVCNMSQRFYTKETIYTY